MQITDPIADLLTRIRNASTAKHPPWIIPASNLKKAICQILVDEGYIKGIESDRGQQAGDHHPDPEVPGERYSGHRRPEARF